MEKIVNTDNNKIYLSSSLNENSFGHTDLGKLITEKGLSATIENSQITEKSPWYFTGTKLNDEGTVNFEGTLPKGNFISLYDLFEQENSPTTEARIKAVITILNEIIEENNFGQTDSITIPGAAAILVAEEDDTIKVLILPGILFERCCQNSKSYPTLQGRFINKGLKAIEAALFTRAVIIYRLLCGEYPFNEENLEKRQADITDHNFIPVEYEVKGINYSLACAVDAGLSVKAEKKVIPGERRFVNAKEVQTRTDTLNEALKLSNNLIEEYFNFTQTDENEADREKFNAARNSFIKQQNRNITIRRFYKRNETRILGTIGAVLILTYAIFSFNKENQKLATSMGLTSTQTVQTLFTGINKADVTIVQEIAKGKGAKSLIQTLSGFYVTNKQRIAMDEKDGTLSPAQWLFFKGTTNFWQYGVTDFKIDDVEYGTNFNYPRRRDKIEPLKNENNLPLNKGDETEHKVNYNLVHYDGDAIIAVIKAEEIVKLRWNGKRWIIRSLTGKTKTLSYRVKNYKDDYLDALQQTDGNIKEACSILREKYSFVPREDELMEAIPYMIEKYNSSAAREYQ